MNLTGIIGKMLGLERTQSIESVEPSLGASWAHDGPAWLFFGCLALAAVAILFYAAYQRKKHVGARAVLAVFRAAVLCLLLLILAEPILTVKVASQRQPGLWLLFDGTDSMGIIDETSVAEQVALAEATGMSPGAVGSASGGAKPARIEYVKSLLQKGKDHLLQKLSERSRLQAFLFDRPEGVRPLELSNGGQEVDPKYLAEQLTTDGKVSALGAALGELARQHATSNLAGLVVFSDFNQNAGPAALAAARRLGVPIHTVGIGSTTAVDVSVALQAPLHVKKNERSTVEVTLRQQGLDGEEVALKLSAERLGGSDADPAAPAVISEQKVVLTAATQTVEIPYVPDAAGRFVLVADVDPMAGEVVRENNQARREIAVTDQFLRLLFVDYEPSWEWRFIKEVFHRDKLVGTEGFRTFLRSSDPRVRSTNPMFLPTISPQRSEFFQYDVIFLGDMPASALTPRFCEMTEEFVRNFGGGLVLISGSRFGPGQLADTPLAKLLPVSVDPAARPYARQPFRLQLSPAAEQYDFMQLGSSPRENREAWDNLGLLTWYQQCERVHPLASVLAEHPEHTCADGKTKQPLIAVRRYGKGEVVYLAFNETWRLRRQYGELYYRQFWGQMIHRLGLSHALGSQKRFVVLTDRRHYQADDQVLLTVEAYDDDFQPLSEASLQTRGQERSLQAELILPKGAASDGDNVQALRVSQLREGVFEARFPVYAGGEHRIRVKDPITSEPVEITFEVSNVTVERQRAVRNVALQEGIAAETGGNAYDLTTVGKLAERIDLSPKTETTIEVISLWNTWLCFGCVVGLLLGEWLLRKWVNLP